jgi:hypothetical protein
VNVSDDSSAVVHGSRKDQVLFEALMRWDWEGGAVQPGKEAADEAESANHEASRENDGGERTNRGGDP